MAQGYKNEVIKTVCSTLPDATATATAPMRANTQTAASAPHTLMADAKA